MVFWIFTSAIVVQCAYALYFFARIFRLPEITTPPGEPGGVSIIICAKDEGANLRRNLPRVLEQKYKGVFEIIVVNDGSVDDTAEVLRELEQSYNNLWDVIITADDTRTLKGKKYALSRGVAIAKYDWLLLTDADCVPASDGWLEQMVMPLGAGKEIVAGYGGYNKSGGLLNAFIRWETMHTFLQYATYALAGEPYMAVGRNMACTKQVLEKAQRTEVWNELPSGDDDLLLAICGTESNSAIVADPRAFTFSAAKRSFKEWVAQKQRHLSTGKYYKPGVKLLLGGYGLSHAIMWISFFVFLCSCQTLPVAFLAARCILFWSLWAVAAVKLRETALIFLFPLFDLAWLLYNFVFFPFIAFKNKQTWK